MKGETETGDDVGSRVEAEASADGVVDATEPSTASGDASVSEPSNGDASNGDASSGEPTGGHAAADGSAEETAEEQLVKLRERLLRTAADYDNYRKRARRDVVEAERRVQEELVRALLPTFDNVERASVHADTASDVKSIADGLHMVMKQFRDTLGGLGIERVESMGKPFDPAEHEAVQHLVTDEVAPGVVTQELQAGYRWQGRLVRPALVVVAKSTPKPADSAGESESSDSESGDSESSDAT